MGKKGKDYKLNSKEAEKLLYNVLDSCNIPQPSGSLEATIRKKALKKQTIAFCTFLAALFLILVIFSPLAFKRDSHFKIVQGSKEVSISSHTLYDDFFVMTLKGDVDYDNIYSRKNNGAYIFPDTVDSESGLVIFPYNGDALNIYIPSKGGECIQAVLNENK